MNESGKIVEIDGKTYYTINTDDNGTEYHLVSTFGMACDLSGFDPYGVEPTELLPKSYVYETGCKIVSNPILNYDDDTMCVLYEDLEMDKSIALDGDETYALGREFMYETTDDNFINITNPTTSTALTSVVASAIEDSGYTLKVEFTTESAYDSFYNKIADEGNNYKYVTYNGVTTYIISYNYTVEWNYQTDPSTFVKGTIWLYVSNKLRLNTSARISFNRKTYAEHYYYLYKKQSDRHYRIFERSGNVFYNHDYYSTYESFMENWDEENDFSYGYVRLQSNSQTIEDNTFKNVTTLKRVTTHVDPKIGASCFSGCTNLERVDIQGSSSSAIDVSAVTIGANAFKDCTKLKTLIFGSYWHHSLNTKIEIGANAFYNCSGLSYFQGQDNIKKIGSEAFRGCAKLSTLTLINCTDIATMAFAECSNLQTVILRGDGTLTNSNGGLFYNVSGITELVFLGNCGSGTAKQTAAKNITTSVYSNLSSKQKENFVLRVQNAYSPNYSDSSAQWNSHIVTYQAESDIVLAGGDNEVLYVDDDDNARGIIETAVAFGWLRYNTRTLTLPEARMVRSIDITDGDLVNDSYIYSDSSDNLEYENVDNRILKNFDCFKHFTGVQTLDESFEDCYELVSIQLPNTITTLDDCVFRNCYKLSAITIPSSVTYMTDDNFENTNSLQTISVASGNEHYLANNNILYNKAFESGEIDKSVLLKYAVYNSATSVTIPNTVKEIHRYAFQQAIKLGSSITIPDSVTEIGNNAFEDVANIIYSTNMTATGSPWGARSVNGYVEGYFVYSDSGKTNLLACFPTISGTVQIPSTVTTISQKAFLNCRNMSVVRIPNSVTTIGWHAFYDCTSLSTVYIGTGLANLDNDAFENTNITSLNISANTIVNKTYSSAYDNFCKIFGNKLATCSIGTSVTKIGDNILRDCNSLVTLTLANGLTSIGNNAFYSCDKLTAVTIPSGVTSIGNQAFRYCNALKTITFNSGSRLTSIGKAAFGSCRAISSVTIPTGVTTIGENAFEMCGELSSITLSSGITTISNDMFYYCPKLTGITIPSGVTTIGKDAFGYCSKMTSITIPNRVTSIGENAFSDCVKLTTVTIPSSVGTIGRRAFYNCECIRNLTIPNSACTIGEKAFHLVLNINYSGSGAGYTTYGAKTKNKYVSGDISYSNSGKTTLLACASCLSSLTVPSSVTSIPTSTGDVPADTMAFRYCYHLTSVTIPSSVTTLAVDNFAWNDIHIGGKYAVNTIILQHTTPPTLKLNSTYAEAFQDNVQYIKVPSSKVNTYKTTGNWVTYADKIVANT